ncbi:vesicular-fusion protein S17, partial [Actinomortierella ambigua]
GAGSYLGVFGQWFVISEIQGTRKSIGRSATGGGSATAAVDGADQSNGLEAQAEAEKERAVQAKIKKDYVGAGKAYVAAARKFEQSGTDFNRWQAGTAFEDAYKAFNMAKKTSDAIASLEQAARLFKSSGRQGSKAAGVYNSLGDILKKNNEGYVANPRRAMEMYKEAAELYQSDSDRRFIQASVRQAEMACLCKEWGIAYDVYQRVVIPESQSEELLRYTIRDHVFNSILCHFGATSGDWIVMRRDIDQGLDLAPDFAGSRGHRLLE